jgi:putative transposase
MQEHGMSQRRACQALGMARSVMRYRKVPDRDDPVIATLQELVERYPERGFGKLFKLIRRRGLAWNHKRVWRVYCALKLNLRRKGKRAYRHESPSHWPRPRPRTRAGRRTSCPTRSGTGGASGPSMWSMTSTARRWLWRSI